MAAPGHAVATPPAHDVPLGADQFAGMDEFDAFADPDDLADELVADDEGRPDRGLGPLVPALDVEVGAADPRPQHADEDLARSGCRVGDLLQPESWLCSRFDQGPHLLVRIPSDVRPLRAGAAR